MKSMPSPVPFAACTQWEGAYQSEAEDDDAEAGGKTNKKGKKKKGGSKKKTPPRCGAEVVSSGTLPCGWVKQLFACKGQMEKSRTYAKYISPDGAKFDSLSKARLAGLGASPK